MFVPNYVDIGHLFQQQVHTIRRLKKNYSILGWKVETVIILLLSCHKYGATLIRFMDAAAALISKSIESTFQHESSERRSQTRRSELTSASYCGTSINSTLQIHKTAFLFFRNVSLTLRSIHFVLSKNYFSALSKPLI